MHIKLTSPIVGPLPDYVEYYRVFRDGLGCPHLTLEDANYVLNDKCLGVVKVTITSEGMLKIEDVLRPNTDEDKKDK